MPALLIGLLLHLYIAARLVPALPGGVAAATALAALLAASAVLVPAAFVGRRARDRRSADRWTWVGMTALGGFSMLLVLTLLRDGLLLAAAALAAASVALPPLAAPTAAAVPLLALAAVLAGAWQARRTAAVREVEVAIDGLPPALHGFTIVQISDLHVGPTVKAPYVQRVVAAANRLDADVVAVTGDLVDGRVADLRDDVAPLAGLQARHGRFFVTGNHEYYSGAPEWCRALRGLGFEVLDNRHVVLEHDGARLLLAGVEDFNAGHVQPGARSDPAAAIAGAPDDVALRVLLAHQPRSAAAAAAAGFDLQLSGHTHGGQFWPWGWFVPLQQPFVAGLHRAGARLQVYVSRGTGYWGPPLRLGAPSEITRLRLVPTAAARPA